MLVIFFMTWVLLHTVFSSQPVHIAVIGPPSLPVPHHVIEEWANNDTWPSTLSFDVNVTSSVLHYQLSSILQLRNKVLSSCGVATLFLSLDGSEQSIVPLYSTVANPVLQLKRGGGDDVTCQSSATDSTKNVVPLPKLLPLHDVISHIFLDTKQRVYKVAIFFNENMTPRFHTVEDEFHRQVIQTEEYLVESDTRSRQIRAWIDKSLLVDALSFNNFLVMCNGQQAAEILHQANLLESAKWTEERAMVYSRWLIVVVEKEDVEIIGRELRTGGISNVAILHYNVMAGTNADDNLKWALYYFSLALNDTLAELELDEYSPSCSNSEPQTTLIARWKSYIDNSSEIASHCSPFTLYVPQASEDGIYLLEQVLCEHAPGAPPALTRKANAFPNEEAEFGNRTFKVGILAYAPFLSEHIPENGTQPVYGGLCVDLLNELAAALNFSYELVKPADGEWGKEGPDGKWTGLVGMMQSKEADMVIAPLFLTDERRSAMDFTTPYLYETTGVLFKPPGEDEGKWRVVIEPFRWHVWICLFACIFLTGLIAWAVTRLSFRLLKDALSQVDDMFRHLQQALWYVIGAVLTQGGAFEPQTISVRCIIGAWWLVCIILVGTYSGNLIAFLTISKASSPFYTVPEMLAQGRYKWGTQGSTAYHDTFMSSKDPLLAEVWSGIEKFQQDDPTVLSTNYDYHVEKTNGRDYIFIMDSTSAILELQKDCEKHVLKMHEFPVYAVPIGLQKNSSLKAKLDQKISSLRESGMVAFWQQKYWPTNRCDGIVIASAKPVDLLDTQSAFYVLCGGLALSLIMLVGERLHSAHVGRGITKVKPMEPVEDKSSSRPNNAAVENKTNDKEDKNIGVNHVNTDPNNTNSTNTNNTATLPEQKDSRGTSQREHMLRQDRDRRYPPVDRSQSVHTISTSNMEANGLPANTRPDTIGMTPVR